MTPRLDICAGPVMDPQCGAMECPDGRHEPTDEDCDRCQALQDDYREDLMEFVRERHYQREAQR